MTKNTKIGIGVGVVLLLVLSSRGNNSDTATPAPAVTVTKTVTEPAPATDVVSSVGMADAIRANDPIYYEVDDATINETAQSICDALQSGSSVEDVLTVAESTIGLEHAPALIAGAISFLCPDQKYKVN